MPLNLPRGEQCWRLSRLSPFVRQSGDDLRKPWYLAERSLFDYLLVYIESGNGVFSVADQIFPVQPGSLVWIPPNTPHMMRGTSELMHCLFLHFDLLYEPKRSHWNAIIPGGLTDLSPWPERMHPPVADQTIAAWRGLLDYQGNRFELLDLLRRLCVEHRRSDGYSWQLSAMMLQLLDMILHHTASSPDAGNRERRLDEASAYVRTHAAAITSIAATARRFGFSNSHFRRLFQERFGLSPVTLLRRTRIREACVMLTHGNDSVTEIADRCGYRSIYSFSRAFKHETGLSPLNYRR